LVIAIGMMTKMQRMNFISERQEHKDQLGLPKPSVNCGASISMMENLLTHRIACCSACARGRRILSQLRLTKAIDCRVTSCLFWDWRRPDNVVAVVLYVNQITGRQIFDRILGLVTDDELTNRFKSWSVGRPLSCILQHLI